MACRHNMKPKSRNAYKKKIQSLILAFSIFICLPAMVVIVRHGEKQSDGYGQLACQGLNRSLKLPAVLLKKFGVADEIYAPNPMVKIGEGEGVWAYIRPLATIEPYAIQLNKPVNLDYGWENPAPIVSRILERDNGLIVIAWEHHGANELAELLMNKTASAPTAISAWPDNDFDRIYVFDIGMTADGRQYLKAFEVGKEGLDGQSQICQ